MFDLGQGRLIVSVVAGDRQTVPTWSNIRTDLNRADMATCCKAISATPAFATVHRRERLQGSGLGACINRRR
jgi:hypothetical protein